MTDGYPQYGHSCSNTQHWAGSLTCMHTCHPCLTLSSPPPSSQAHACQCDECPDVCEICYIMESISGPHLQDTCLCRFVVNMLPSRPRFSVPVRPRSHKRPSRFRLLLLTHMRREMDAICSQTFNSRPRSWLCLSIRLCPHLPHIHTC